LFALLRPLWPSSERCTARLRPAQSDPIIPDVTESVLGLPRITIGPVKPTRYPIGFVHGMFDQGAESSFAPECLKLPDVHP
jgi:hypothetical protein